MTVLMKHEFVKFFHRRKVLIGSLVFIALLVLFVLQAQKLEKSNDWIDLNNCRQNLQNAESAVKQDNEKTSPAVRDYDRALADLRKRQLKAKTGGDWRQDLKIQIEMNRREIAALRNGTLAAGESIDQLQQEIALNQIFLSRNIRPVWEDTMNGLNFLKWSAKNILPLLFVMLILLLTSDALSAERDEGTLKLLCMQPVSRVKLLLSKYFASFGLCVSLGVAIFGSFFLVLGLINGFGSVGYPIQYSPNAFRVFLDPAALDFNSRVTTLGVYLLWMLPLVLLMIAAAVAFALLFSTLIANSAAAVSVTILIYIAFYVMVHNLKFLNEILHLIPFAYFDAASVSSGEILRSIGNFQLTYFNGLIVLSVFTLLCAAVSAFWFRKKDLFC